MSSRSTLTPAMEKAILLLRKVLRVKATHSYGQILTPSGINTRTLEALHDRGLIYIGIWGSARPKYVDILEPLLVAATLIRQKQNLQKTNYALAERLAQYGEYDNV